MKIAIYGASGMIGRRVAAEALARGHEVVGVSRSGGEVPAGVRAVQGDALDVDTARRIAAEADAVVSTIGPSRTGGDHQEYLDALGVLSAAAAEYGVRLLQVGGAGSLEVDGQRMVDLPGFPDIYRAEALTAAAGLAQFRAADEKVDWTVMCPPSVVEPGERTGTYRQGLDQPIGDHISAEDFALALLDELEQPQHSRHRFTVATS